jgi:hypothetical protein
MKRPLTVAPREEFRFLIRGYEVIDERWLEICASPGNPYYGEDGETCTVTIKDSIEKDGLNTEYFRTIAGFHEVLEKSNTIFPGFCIFEWKFNAHR